jgi:hypothetical protein
MRLTTELHRTRAGDKIRASSTPIIQMMERIGEIGIGQLQQALQ